MRYLTQTELAGMTLEQLRTYGTDLVAHCTGAPTEDPRLMPAAADYVDQMAEAIEHGFQPLPLANQWMGNPSLHRRICERLTMRNDVLREVRERIANDTRKHRLEMAIHHLIVQQVAADELLTRGMAARRLAIAARSIAQDLRAQAGLPAVSLSPEDLAEIEVIFA